MIVMKKLQGLAPVSFLALLTLNAPVWAAEELTVNADQSQIVSVDRAPGTVVVGNPTIADVTIQGNQLFIHGRVFGKTNIIVLDENGNQLAEYAVNVVTDDSYNAVVFKPDVPGKPIIIQSYTCKTDCESVFHIGDHADYYKLINEQQKNKLGLAQGQKPGENGDNGGGQTPPAQ
jgi:Flp pilus assembly secretin CpaC